jgi:hypothetical protein
LFVDSVTLNELKLKNWRVNYKFGTISLRPLASRKTVENLGDKCSNTQSQTSSQGPSGTGRIPAVIETPSVSSTRVERESDSHGEGSKTPVEAKVSTSKTSGLGTGPKTAGRNTKSFKGKKSGKSGLAPPKPTPAPKRPAVSPPDLPHPKK